MPSDDEKKDLISPSGSTNGNAAGTGSAPEKTTQQKNLDMLQTFQELVGIRTPANVLSTGTLPGREMTDLEKQTKTNIAMMGTSRSQDLAKGRPQRNWKDLVMKTTVTNDGIYGRSIDEALMASIGRLFGGSFAFPGTNS